MQGVPLAGIDLAWHGLKPSGLALGRLNCQILHVDTLVSDVLNNESICRLVKEYQPIGIAIDAPLIINNPTGMRECEREIGRRYGAKGASCHTANLSLFPNATSVQLSQQLQKLQYEHMIGSQWQIEVYPHPAIIELFSLNYRLAYKKGTVALRKAGQLLLANHLKGLAARLPFALQFGCDITVAITENAIQQLKGEQLKQNEDKLDALVCLVIAALHHLNFTFVVGNQIDGYIILPAEKFDINRTNSD